MEVKRASGPGGQHVNKVETAVKLLYLPLNLTAVASEERSQTMNKKLALARLVVKVRTENLKKEATAGKSNGYITISWKEGILFGFSRGSPLP